MDKCEYALTHFVFFFGLLLKFLAICIVDLPLLKSPFSPHPPIFSRFISEQISKSLVFSGNTTTHPCHVAAFDPPTSAMPNQSTGKKAALLRLVRFPLPPTLRSACSRNLGLSCSKQAKTNVTHFFYPCLVILLG